MISSPEPNTYGQYARTSLIADYVELTALKQPVKRGIVAEFFADTGWDLGLIVPSENGSADQSTTALNEQIDNAQYMASVVFEHMDERSRILGNRYPYALADDIVTLKDGTDLESSPYLAMLSLTIAHAFNVTVAQRPVELFEQVVTRVLADRGLLSAGVAAARRDSGCFETALCMVCEGVGLKAEPNAVARLARAHDEGVDVLCHFNWEDDIRNNAWVFIGQVTVGRSDSWLRKIREPSPAEWAQLVGINNRPVPFLAVPHHVEQRMMDRLSTNGEGVVLDRLRLVRFKEENDCAEREIVRAVTQECVESLMG